MIRYTIVNLYEVILAMIAYFLRKNKLSKKAQKLQSDKISRFIIRRLRSANREDDVERLFGYLNDRTLSLTDFGVGQYELDMFYQYGVFDINIYDSLKTISKKIDYYFCLATDRKIKKLRLAPDLSTIVETAVLLDGLRV